MLLNSNNYNKANFNISQNNMTNNNNINKNMNFGIPLMQNYINYHRNNNNNYINQTRFFNNNNFPMSQYQNPYQQQIKQIPNYTNYNQLFPSYNIPSQNKKNNHPRKTVEIECICNNKNSSVQNDLIQCILCHKYQHKSCIHQAGKLSPYICFNCQFKNNHFYLRYIKTILPAQEFIYKKQWEEDPSFLKEGTKNFEFHLDLKELYKSYNINMNNISENNSYYLAFLCLTNNGKPFQLGFPDNINITINGKKFYNTESKGFKRPLLLALENNKYYIPKRRHLITLDKYEIPNAADFFSDKNLVQKVTISFANNLENYRGSEFEFVDIRHYLIYIGLFQEIKIPDMSRLKECKSLEEYNQIFKNFYEEKVKKFKWEDVANFISLGNEQLNMNLVSQISNQKIINPVRGLFCQHSEVMDFSECCGYITSNNQVYKCVKCNKPLYIMYIDDKSENLFNKYIKGNFSQIYYTNDFKFIRGEKIEENPEKAKENKNIEKQSENEEDDSLSESFFKFHENKIKIGQFIAENDENYQEQIQNEVIEINSDTDSVPMEPNNINNNEYPSLNITAGNINMEIENNLQKNSNDSNINENIHLNNSDKSNGQTQLDSNIGDYALNSVNETSKNNEEIITLMEDDDDDDNYEKENQNNNYSIPNNNFLNLEKDKENKNDNNSLNKQNQINKNIGNIIAENTGNKKNEKNIENENAMNQQKNIQDVFNASKKSEGVDERTNIFLEKKRNKILNKKKKKEIGNENDDIGNEIYSPRKRIKLRRIEPSPSLKNKNKNNIKERKLRKNNDKINNGKKTISKEINNINNNSKESMSNEQKNNRYINTINTINTTNNNLIPVPKEKAKRKNAKDEINNNHINNNNKAKNKSEIKNKRRNSDLSSSSNSYNMKKTNNGHSELNNNNKKRKKKLINAEKEKEKENSKKNSDKNVHLDRDEFNGINIINNKFEEIQINNEENDDDEEYETIMIDRKDLIEIKPYKEYQEKNRILNEENEEEFLNDFDIFENELLSNNNMEFINYDYYNIQRRLREYCSIRYQDDEIFNGNKTFFNKFK